jgi:hypothetical protein
MANTRAMLSLLAPFVGAGCPCRLTIVLGNVVYASGLAPRLCVWVHERLRARGGRLTLRDPPGALCEEAEALGLARALDIRRRGPRRGGCASRPGTPAARGDACPPLEIGR